MNYYYIYCCTLGADKPLRLDLNRTYSRVKAEKLNSRNIDVDVMYNKCLLLKRLSAK